MNLKEFIKWIVLRNKMFFLLKKFMSQLFVSVIFEQDQHTLKAQIYKNNQLVDNFEKVFKDEKKLLTYVKTYSKKFHIYHISLFLHNQEQGLLPTQNPDDFSNFNIPNISIKSLKFNNATIYSATEHIEYFSDYFEEYNGLDFIYSPFVLLYECIQKQKKDKNKTILYAFRHNSYLTLMICKNKELLFGDYKIFEDEIGLELDTQDEEELEHNQESHKDEDINLDNLGKTLDEKINALDTQESAKQANVETEEIKLEELNNFSSDMDVCRYIFSSIEKFYNGENYNTSFIDELIIFSNEDMTPTALKFIENEIFTETKFIKINTLELMIELMRKELR